MIKKFNISILKSNNSKEDCDIVIPDWILDNLISLCDKKVEYCGQLIIYNKIVEFAFICGSGSIGHVSPTKKMIINNENYSIIEFHTHPESLGTLWMDKFSDGDLATFSNRIQQEGEQYAHALFTKTHILTFRRQNAPHIRIGFGNTDKVIALFNQWNKNYKCWDL